VVEEGAHDLGDRGAVDGGDNVAFAQAGGGGRAVRHHLPQTKTTLSQGYLAEVDAVIRLCHRRLIQSKARRRQYLTVRKLLGRSQCLLEERAELAAAEFRGTALDLAVRI